MHRSPGSKSIPSFISLGIVYQFAVQVEMAHTSSRDESKQEECAALLEIAGAQGTSETPLGPPPLVGHPHHTISSCSLNNC